jgi:hypothetical protein
MVENGCRLLLCDTQADNMPARNFFERTGFSNIEVRPQPSIGLERSTRAIMALWMQGGCAVSRSLSETRMCVVWCGVVWCGAEPRVLQQAAEPRGGGGQS